MTPYLERDNSFVLLDSQTYGSLFMHGTLTKEYQGSLITYLCHFRPRSSQLICWEIQLIICTFISLLINHLCRYVINIGFCFRQIHGLNSLLSMRNLYIYCNISLHAPYINMLSIPVISGVL